MAPIFRPTCAQRRILCGRVSDFLGLDFWAYGLRHLGSVDLASSGSWKR